MKKIVFLTLILTGIMFHYVSASEIIDHSGRTDARGCHYDHIRGGYHCH